MVEPSKLYDSISSPSKLRRLDSGSSVLSNDHKPLMDLSESRKLPSSQYKGVVPQPNGRWGAQIYEKHHRVWLGTFETESQAALSYDIAVCKIRGCDAIINFAPIQDQSELDFIMSRSKAEIVDMLRKHTYQDELNQSKRLGPSSKGPKRKRNDTGKEQMFEKVVTPSDVGKLNRLVIPKLSAEKHFPLGEGSSLLSFEDECGKVWRFRYSYWNSSQSYVLTKGWSRFVKEKGLKAGGIVAFGRLVGVEKQFYIECRCGGSGCKKSLHEVEPAEGIAARSVFRLFGVNYALFDAAKKEIDQLIPVEIVEKQCVQAL